MNIFAICKKGKGYFIEFIIGYVETVFSAVERSKGFPKTPKRSDDSLRPYCFVEEHIYQI